MTRDLSALAERCAALDLRHASNRSAVVPYVAVMQGERELARDPMPAVELVIDGCDAAPRRVLQADLPGPRCLRALADALGLSEDERAEYRLRESDAAAMLAERVAWVREASRLGLDDGGLSALLQSPAARRSFARAWRRRAGAKP